ncbi:MAG TPA: hypothetical protein VJT31_42145, partial [Rugosimonospora sp.]|nr:hypothetical protein [Rugosimonospora sp.]
MPDSDEEVEPYRGRHRLPEPNPAHRPHPRGHRLAAVALLASIGIGSAGAMSTGPTTPAATTADSAVSMLLDRGHGTVTPATAR